MLEIRCIGQEYDTGFDGVRASSYDVVALQGGKALWEKKGEEFCAVLNASCSDFLSQGKIRQEQTRLRKEISDPDTTVIILQNQTGAMVGFTYTLPDLTDDATIQKLLQTDFAGTGMTEADVLERQKRTAQIGWTVISPKERSKGGWTLMMDEVDKQLANSGKFDEFIQVVRLDGDYAKKVAGRYNERIVYREPFYTSGRYGHQRYFRVRV